MNLLSKLFNFIIFTTKKYSIDESHGLSHSMNVLTNAYNIYEDEVKKNTYLKDQEKIIFISAILHDMCDKKYMNESEGVKNIETFLNNKITQLKPHEIDITKKIITTMSYSTVQKNGFPNLNEYQLAYHIVRESDLLSAIDFDRCMIYNMNKMNGDINQAYTNSIELFENRIFKHDNNNLYITDYSKKQDLVLRNIAKNRINIWKKVLKMI
jgi:HD superfamily phosphodiesterase